MTAAPDHFPYSEQLLLSSFSTVISSEIVPERHPGTAWLSAQCALIRTAREAGLHERAQLLLISTLKRLAGDLNHLRTVVLEPYFEHAEVARVRHSVSRGINILHSMQELRDISEDVKRRAMALEWCWKFRSRSVDFKTAVEFMKVQTEGDDTCQLFMEYAAFADNLFKSASDFHKSPEFQAMVQCSQLSGRQSLLGAVLKDEIANSEAHKSDFLNAALEAYCRALRYWRGDSLVEAMRWLSLWVRAGNSVIANVLLKQVETEIPLAVLVKVAPQMLSRLEDSSEGSNTHKLLFMAMSRVCKSSHFHHVAFQLLSYAGPVSSETQTATNKEKTARGQCKGLYPVLT